MQVDQPLDLELREIRDRLLKEMAARAAGRAATPAGGGVGGKPVKVTDATFDDVVRAHPLVVVDAWAPWCGPCRVLGPVLDRLAGELADRVVIAKLNVDENPRVPMRYQVSGIPTLLVFKDGQLIDRIVGALPHDALKRRILAY